MNRVQCVLIVPMLLFVLILVGNITMACCLSELKSNILVSYTDTFKL